MTNLTPASLKLFLALAEDAGNWSGTPLFGGNFSVTKEDRGNLTDLKVKGLVTTEQDSDNRKCVWVYFTDAGKALALQHGFNVDEG